jgi:hypothetical protein
MAASHRCAVALNLPTLPALERLRCVGELAIALAETMAESGHYYGSRPCLGSGPKGGFINEPLAAGWVHQ